MTTSFHSRRLACAAYLAVAFSFVLGGCASETYEHSAARPVLQTSPLDISTPPAGFYRVKSGDTLASIAAAYGRDATAIAAWNGLSANASLTNGQLLHVGPPSTSLAGSERSAQQSTNAASCRPDAFSWPVKGPVLKRFGADGLKAVLIGGEAGDTIRAAQSGRVVYTGDKIAGYGSLVILKHGNQYLTAYGYNRSILVKEGSDVAKGQAIATLGEQPGGRPALLFEVRRDRQPVDPLPYLSDCAS
ncbi:peptidase M23B [Caballeronia temeraria]|uniref:Peptidase M23B n=1 Tax=Caballeronia temeraria TaxID=1777137 RepID=A0A157ZX36_9BURK|nr:peptidoglycan DD-metalloendopeptidase family protein [Caballeronia temeraria]SAK50081.1 peptidase M23B [Caballeronia temeraria]